MATKTVYKPFKHQLISLKHDEKCATVLDLSDPGTGKTMVRIKAFEKRRKAGSGALLVLAPRSLLGSVWAADFKKYAPDLKVSVANAANREKAFAVEADVYVTNVDAAKWLAAKNKAFFKRFSEVVVDECFPAGTLVDTPYGQCPIALIKIGDVVNTSAGPLPVTNTFVSQSNVLIRLELEDGTEIYCTENHPIATSGGWCNAGDCDGLFAVRVDVHQYPQSRAALLRQTMREDGFLGDHANDRLERADSQNVQVPDGQVVLEQRNPLPRNNESQTQRDAQVVGTQAKGPRREWKSEQARDHGCGNAPGDVGASIHNQHETAEGQRVSIQLQAGFCEHRTEEDIGDRREFAHVAKALGCEERFILGFSRVVGISRHELGNPVHVYNLQVDGPHDYSVEGTLVHNCTAFKHHTSQRSKAAAKIMTHFARKAFMTGTPTSNTVTDIWHLAMMLDGGKRLGNSFYRFRDTVATPYQQGRNAQAIKWIDKEGAEEAVFGLLEDIVVRHKFEDCVDIPPNHKYSVGYELSPKQLKAYEELEGTQMLFLAKKISAINAAAVTTKLQQVASGAVYHSEGDYEVVDTGRYEMILDLVEQRKHSLVIFLWKHQRDCLIAEAEKRGVTFAVLDGGSSDRERTEIVQGYQAGVYQVIFGHPKTIAHGYTLTKGTATIWASPTYDLEWFAQGSKRQHRIGQTQKTETIVVVAEGTIDEKVYDNMLGKDARMTNLLDLFGSATPKPVKTTVRKAVAA